MRPYEEPRNCQWWKGSECDCIGHSCSKFCSATFTVGGIKMVEEVVGVTCDCRIIGYRRNWLNGWEIDAATCVCVLRWLNNGADKSFVLRCWGNFQALCYATNWKRVVQYSVDVISTHLEIGYGARTSELYGCNVISLCCLLFSCWNNARTKISSSSNNNKTNIIENVSKKTCFNFQVSSRTHASKAMF